MLAEYFIKKFNTVLKKDVWSISNEVKNAFMNYDWPGNVRELENSIESAMNMVIKDHILKPHHFANMKSLFNNKKGSSDYKMLIHENKSDEILVTLVRINQALKSCSNITKSAERLESRDKPQHKLKNI